MCDRCAELEARLALLHRAAAFYRSAIKSGEPVDCGCDECINAARALAATADDAAAYDRKRRIEGIKEGYEVGFSSCVNQPTDTATLTDPEAEQVADYHWPPRTAGSAPEKGEPRG